MLARIDLRDFKCFRILKLPLRPLTLLSGTNASGKSSVIQALVLLHQTMRDHEWSSHLMLNGGAARLGTTADVIDQVYGHRTFEISLYDDDGSFVRWEVEGERTDMAMFSKTAVRVSRTGAMAQRWRAPYRRRRSGHGATLNDLHSLASTA